MTALQDRFAARLRALVEVSGAEAERLRAEVLPVLRDAARRRAEKKGADPGELEAHADRDHQVATWTARIEARGALDDDPNMVDAYAGTLAAEVEDLANELFPDDALRARALAALDVDGWPLLACDEGAEAWVVGVTGVLAPSCRFGSFPDPMDLDEPAARIREKLSRQLEGPQLEATCTNVLRETGNHLRKNVVSEEVIGRLRALLGRWHDDERLDKLCGDARTALPYAVVVRPRGVDARVWPEFIQPHLESGSVRTPAGEVLPIGPEDTLTVFRTNPSEMPPATDRPWWPAVGLALLLDAERRVRPDLAAWRALRREREEIEPGEATRAAARAAVGGGENADGTMVDPVAQAVYGQLPAFLAAVWPDGAPAVDDATREADSGGLLRASEAAAGFLAGMGPTGEEMAAALRNASEKGWQTFASETADAPPTPEALQALWAPWRTRLEVDVKVDDAGNVPVRWKPRIGLLDAIARAVHAAAAGAIARSPEIRIPGREVKGGDFYAKIPRFVQPLLWGVGNAGVEVGGERYANEPQFAARVAYRLPHDARLVARRRSYKPSPQLPLALDKTSDALASLVGRSTGRATANDPGIIPVGAAKMALVLSAATGPGTGTEIVGANAREWHDWLRPGQPWRNDYATEYAAYGTLLGDLWTFVPTPSERLFWFHLWRTYIVADPSKPSPDDRILGGLDLHALQIHKGLVAGVESYRNEFFLNLDAVLRLGGHETTRFRTALWAHKEWDAWDRRGEARTAGKAPPVPWYSPRELAAHVAVRSRAVEKGGRAAQNEAARDGQRAVKALKALADSPSAPLKLEVTSKHPKRYRPIPPEKYLDAYSLHRRNRPDWKKKP